MSGYVVAGYGVTVGALVLYAAHLVRRLRRAGQAAAVDEARR